MRVRPVNSAHLASLASPDTDRWLPIFWAVDACKSSQAQDVKEGHGTMGPVEESKVPPSQKALAEWQAAGALQQPIELARALARRLAIPWGGGTLVCPPIDDAERVRDVLARERIKAAFRGTALRFSTHVYNDEADIERAAAAIAPLVAQPVKS